MEEYIAGQWYYIWTSIMKLNKTKQQKRRALRVHGSLISRVRKRHLIQFRKLAGNYTARARMIVDKKLDAYLAPYFAYFFRADDDKKYSRMNYPAYIDMLERNLKQVLGDSWKEEMKE